MTEKKGWGSAVLGWFIVQDETGDGGRGEADPEGEPSPPSEDDRDVIARAAAAPSPPVFSGEPPPPPARAGSEIDFEGVFEAAGLSAEERERVGKAAELLRNLPAGTDAAVKKQIVEASLKAFGVPIESIIETGVGQIQALEAYIRKGAADTQAAAEETDRKIAAFEDEIRRLRGSVDEKVAVQKSLAESCNRRKLEVQQVLEFFGRDTVARVVRDSPKLHSPEQQS